MRIIIFLLTYFLLNILFYSSVYAIPKVDPYLPANQCGDGAALSEDDKCPLTCPLECPTTNFQGMCQCFKKEFTDIGSVISALLPYIFVIAGLILFGLLISNGFTFLTSGGDPKKTEGAKSGITAALIGFLIIFASYWIIQILQYILGINILGGP